MNKARSCFLTIIIIIVLTLLILLCISLSNSGKDRSGITGGSLTGQKNLLFLGIDEREDSDTFKGRTDTIIVFHIGKWGEKDSLISIPRDTRVDLEGHGWNKINAAYVYGGTDMLKDEIYELTGIPVDRVMLINFKSFINIIDILGGVEITVEEPLHDPLSGADFEPGVYIMSGEQALSFARTRATARADIDRMGRQQYLLNELIRQKFNLSMIFKAPELIGVLNRETVSDFTIWDFCSAGFVLLFSNKDINRLTIPTEPANIEGISYLLADPVKTRDFLSQYMSVDY